MLAVSLRRVALERRDREEHARPARRLVAVLAYSAFINEVNMSEVGLQHFPAFEERAATGSVRQS